MSKTLWNTIKLEVPRELVNITHKNKVVVKKSLTKTNSIAKSNKEQSIKIIPGDVNKPKIINDGKEWNIEELKIRMKKAKDLTKKNEGKVLKKKSDNKIIKDYVKMIDDKINTTKEETLQHIKKEKKKKLIKEEPIKLMVKKVKSVTKDNKENKDELNDKLTDEPNPAQADFDMHTQDSTKTRSDKLRESAQEQLDKIREQARKSEQKKNATMHSLATQTTPKPSPRAISTQTTPKPSPRATPQATPQATPRPSQEATPLNLLLHPSPRYIEPTTSLSPGTVAGVTRARTSGIQEHTGVLTRNLRREVGEAHTELKSKLPKSKDPEYVSGYEARRNDDRKGKMQKLVPAHNIDNKFNQGYYRKELKINEKLRKEQFENKLRTQLSSRSKNPFSGSDGSASEMSASERSYTRSSTRQAQRMRSTMLSQILTPESNMYVNKSGNKSN
jgi:hypothetical protein